MKVSKPELAGFAAHYLPPAEPASYMLSVASVCRRLESQLELLATKLNHVLAASSWEFFIQEKVEHFRTGRSHNAFLLQSAL